MNLLEAMAARHSVRSYTDKSIEGETLAALEHEIEECNKESGLRIQLITNEAQAFSGMMAHYGKFRNVKNYIALVGQKSPTLDETIGYYGERIVLKAQSLGLNTCWVALTYRKKKARCIVHKGEKLLCVLALGYGATQGTSHKNKPLETLCDVETAMPSWFRKGMEAALLAPTASNQQKFYVSRRNSRVTIKATGGFYSKVDLGIVKYHFESGAGKENFTWE